MKCRIVLRHMPTWKPWCKDEIVLDYADDLGHARYLAAEYRAAYGCRIWKIVYERNG